MGVQENSPDVVIGMLKVFSIDIYVLLNFDAALSFVTPLIVKRFGIFHEHFIVSTLVSESIVAKTVY